MSETFNRGKPFEERIAQALIVDHNFAEQMKEVLDLDYFSLEYVREIVKAYFSYHDKYKAFPSFKLFESDVISRNISNDTIKEKAKTYLHKIKKEPLNGDLQYTKDESLDFCRKKKLQLALENVINLTHEKKYDEIVPIIQKALQAGGEKDIGHVYSEHFEARMIRENREPISTGWPEIDKILRGGLAGGQLGVIPAPTSVGKSHALASLGCAAAKAGHNVAHYTFELSEHVIGNRYDSNISSISIDDIFDKKDEVKEAVNKVPGGIVIKAYPTKTATVGMIRNHIHKLTLKGMRPNVIIIDYADIMRSRKGYEFKRYELETIYEDLRALAMELDVPVWTASQTNRGSFDDDVVSLSAISESFAKAMIADFIMTMSRNSEDRLNNTGRFHVAKNRSGPDGMTFPFLINTSTSKIQVLQQRTEDDDLSLLTGEDLLKRRMQKQFKKFEKKGMAQ